MLFELKISTDNAAEFSSFAADFHKFLEKWNTKPLNESSAPAKREVTRPETESVGNGALPAKLVSQPSLSDREGVASVPETVTPPSPAVSGTEVSEKPKRHRRTKAEIEAARTAESAPAAKTDTALADSNVTIDDVKAEYNAMCKALGPKSRGVSAEMLLELGVAKFSELKSEQFRIAIDKMRRKATQPTKTADAIDDEITF